MWTLMWVLDVEIIRDLNQSSALRKVPVERLLADRSSGSSPNRLSNARQRPTNFPDEAFIHY